MPLLILLWLLGTAPGDWVHCLPVSSCVLSLCYTTCETLDNKENKTKKKNQPTNKQTNKQNKQANRSTSI